MRRLVLFFREQMSILMLLKPTVYKEIACCYNGKMFKEDIIAIKHRDLGLENSRSS